MSPARIKDLDCRSSFINGDLTAENAENAQEDDLDCRSSFINGTINVMDAANQRLFIPGRKSCMCCLRRALLPIVSEDIVKPQAVQIVSPFLRSPRLHDVRLLPCEAIGHASSRTDGPSSAKPVIAGLGATLSFDSAGGRSLRLTTDFTDFTDGSGRKRGEGDHLANAECRIIPAG